MKIIKTIKIVITLYKSINILTNFINLDPIKAHIIS